MRINQRQIIVAVCVILIALTTLGALSWADQKIPINSLPDIQLYAELVAVDGIGQTLATRCVSYRREHGGITVGELVEVQGIGSKRLAEIKKRFKD